MLCGIIREKPNLKTMQTITHILTLPVNQSTIDFALVCAGIVSVRIGLSIVMHKLTK
jgi:hypothetical protein